MRICPNSTLLTPVFALVVLLFWACSCGKKEKTKGTVQVLFKDNRYELQVNGLPFFIKGAGGNGSLKALHQMGGNTLRTWSTVNAKAVLDSAQKYGLKVMMGLALEREKPGFSYNDLAAVRNQQKALEKEILKYKDHPALLMWLIGNELELVTSNYRIWRAINQVAKFIHQNDPNHPTATTISFIGRKNGYGIRFLAQEVDILCINKFGGLPNVRKEVERSGWNGAYVISEWGSRGYWETRRTAWDVPLELTTTEKAIELDTIYEKHILGNRDRCLGSSVFFWGFKNERTPTWFSQFTYSGENLATQLALQKIWANNYDFDLRNSAYIEKLLINGKSSLDADHYLRCKSVAKAQVQWLVKPENARLHWEIREDNTGKKLGEGGDAEALPVLLDNHIIAQRDFDIIFKAPDKEIPCRIYLYATIDGYVHTANIPFYASE